ncbi:MAG: hypothetical protein DMD78_09455 [Candidatus Rokuibacteriota bacterium]|nr:MAG: hypothetical protein DMD78_09455 [Candidatus Rokubacteria bacterium]
MATRCSGNGLILAGLVVTLIGLAIVLTRTFHIPREWTTLGVGLALLVAGVARRALRRTDAA